MNRLVFILILMGLQMTAEAQIISTYAGNGVLGYSGDGGPASAAAVAYPNQIVMDVFGQLYIYSEGYVIRKVNNAGIITTIAGKYGVSGYTGDGGPATAAEIGFCFGMAADRHGNLYFAQEEVVRKIDTQGIISTIAGKVSAGYSGDGGPASAARLNWPRGMAIDYKGNLYIADADNNVVRKIDTAGIITTVAGKWYNSSFGVGQYGGDAGPATDAYLYKLSGVAVDREGNLYILDDWNYRVRKVNTSGIISTIAGTGVGGRSGDNGPATAAQLVALDGITVDSNSNVYISHNNGFGAVRKINSAGIIYIYAGNGIRGFSGDGGFPTLAQINYPLGISMGGDNTLYIADEYNHRIRKVSPPLFADEAETIHHKAEDVVVYPNPARDILTVTATNKIANVSICNAVGLEVYANTYNARNVQINIAGLPSGVYFIRVNGVVIKKFVKH